MSRVRILFTAVFTLALLAIPSGNSSAQDDAIIELHWRGCATSPTEGTSWYEHCHDGPWRTSAQSDYPATFIAEESGESFESVLDGNGDALVPVPAGTYTYQHPPFHWAEANELVCSYVDENGEPLEQLEDSTSILVETGDHVFCDFYVVWGEGGASVVPIEPTDPQGMIELRWRACAEQPVSNEEWFNACFDPESELGLEPQTDRRVSVQNSEDNTQFNALLDENGNAQIVVVPGSYSIPRMTGDFVVADYLYCSTVDADGTAVDTDIESDPLVVEDGAHIVCDYYFVAE